MLDAWIARQIGAAPPLTREALDRWLLERLQRVVDYARERSKFYAAHLPARPISSLLDFAALPFTTADDLRRCGGQMLCVRPDQVDRVVTLTTSGSTGQPKRIYFTAGDQALTVDYFHHGMAEFVSPGDRVMSLFPGQSPGCLNDLLFQALERMGVQPLFFGFPTPERYRALLDSILEQGATSLVGPAEPIAQAARLSQSLGLDHILASQLHSVLLAAAYVSPVHRDTIRTIWHCRVDEHYGMTETGLAGAVGCRAAPGYHPWESGLYYEIISPDTGLPLPDGQAGELVVTTLNRTAMPFLRYRTGDRSRFLPGPCPCGSVLRRLDWVGDRPAEKKFQRPFPTQL